MTDKAYPELPEPADELAMEDGFNVIGTQPVFTADQMRAYYDLGWKAGCKHGAWASRPAAGSGISGAEWTDAIDWAMSCACVKAWDASSYTSGACDAVHPMYAAAFEAGARALLAMAPATTQAQEAAGLSDKQIEALLDAPEVPAEDSGLNTYYTREQVIEHMQEAAILAACIVTKSAAPTQPQPEHKPSPHVANTVDCGHEAGSNEAFERWYAQYHEDACVMYGGLSGNPKDVAHDAWDSALAYPAAPPTAPVEAVTAQGDEVIPPRPAGYNDASTDPGSPLQRWGKPRHVGAKLLLQPLDDGYWTPWHIANEMLRSAQSGDEAQLLDWLESLPQVNIERVMRRSSGEMLHEVTPLAHDSFDGKTLRDALRAAREAMGGDGNG